VRQRKAFSKLENRKFRVYKLKGGLKVTLKKPYSLKRRGKFIDLYRGKKRISYFGEGVAPITIERYALGYEANLQKEEKEKEKEKERRRKMWTVPKESLRRDLPPGFSLEEDEDFVHLVFGKTKCIATFYSRSANPEAIRKLAFEHLRKRKEVL